MIGFHGIGNSHMFEDEEMGNYHPEIENGDSNGDNETGIIGALGNKLEKTFKNSLSAMKSEHAEKVCGAVLSVISESGIIRPLRFVHHEPPAPMAESVDAADSKSAAARRASSSLARGTN